MRGLKLSLTLEQRESVVERQQIEAAATTIWNARCDRKRLSEMPDGQTPQSIGDGFAVQQAIIALSGQKIGGWKIACTAKPVQELFGVEEPFFGAVFGSVLLDSPAEIDAARFPLGCVETEVAFRIGSDMPPRGTDYSSEDVRSAVDAVLPAFELIEPRFDSLLTDAAPLAFADCALNGGLVVGEPLADWREIDLAALPIALSVDGETVAEGQGANALGHPLKALQWLANAMSARGLTLEAGQIVASGTCTGINYVKTGQLAVGEFGPLGHVQLRLI